MTYLFPRVRTGKASSQLPVDIRIKQHVGAGALKEIGLFYKEKDFF